MKLLPVAALLAALAVPALAGTPPWLRADTPRFVLYAQADRDSVVRLARSLESMSRVLELDGLGARSVARAPMVMIAFADGGQFERALPARDGERPHFAGLNKTTSFGSWMGFALYDASGRMVAHHEFLHTLVAEVIGRAPLCMNEGLAEFYSTFRIDGTRCEFGHPIDWHRGVLQRLAPMTLDSLFAVRTDSPLYGRGGDPQDLFYAESWALTHYLSKFTGYSHRFRELAVRIADGATPREAFAHVYPELDWDKVPKALRAYVDTDVEHLHELTLSSPLDPATIVVRNARAGEVETEIGLWRMGSGDETYTRSLFAAGLRSLESDGMGEAGLGLDDLLRDRTDAAIPHLRAAVAHRGASARSLGLAGAGLCLASGSVRQADLLSEATAALERSLDVDSLDANALGWYGRAAVARGEVTPRALRALTLAVGAYPVDATLAAAYASALDEAGDEPGARKVLASHRALVTDPEARAQVATHMDLRALDDSLGHAMTRGDPDAAERALDAFERDHPDSASRELAGRLRGEVRAQATNVRAVKNFNRATSEVNRRRYPAALALMAAARDSTTDDAMRKEAVRRIGLIQSMMDYERGLGLVRTGKLEAALQVFEDVARTAGDPGLRAQAQSSADQLRKMKRR